MILFVLMAALSATPRVQPVESVGGRELAGRVLQIELPESTRVSHGTLRWISSDADEIRQRSIPLRPGRSTVEMRGTPGWEGKLRQAALILPPEIGEVKCVIGRPTWTDEWQIATQPRPIELTLINKGTPLPIGGGWQIRHLTQVLAGGLIAALALRRVPLPAAILLGGIGALAFVEVRESLDRWSVAEAGRPDSVPGLAGTLAFERRAAPHIAGRPWTMQGVDAARKYQMLYLFAEQPYVFEPEKAQNVVTSTPVADPLVQVEDLSLVRGPAHE